MIRIIFENGEIMTCDHVERVYIEERTFNTIEFHIVDRIKEEKDVRKDNRGITSEKQ